MKKLAIVTDTSANLAFDQAKKAGLALIPYSVRMGGVVYQDMVELDSRTFYEQMTNHDDLSTGTPPLTTVSDALEKLHAQGYTDALCLTSAPQLTGMAGLYHALEKAGDCPLKLHPYPTRQIGPAVGLMAMRAAQWRDQGCPVEDILKKLPALDQASDTFALFRTLSYVRQGGRLGHYRNILGNILNIQPVLTINQAGRIELLSKKRGKKRSFQALLDTLEGRLRDIGPYWLSIFSGYNDLERESLKEALAPAIERADFYLERELTPVLGVHAGPGAIGAALLPLEAKP